MEGVSAAMALKRFEKGISGNPGGRPKGVGLAKKAVILAADELGGGNARDRLLQLCEDEEFEKKVFWPRIWLPVVMKGMELDEDEELGYEELLDRVMQGFRQDNGLLRDVLKALWRDDSLQKIVKEEFDMMFRVIHAEAG